MNSAYPSPCDAGYYSGRNASRTSSCFGACPQGHYCPPGTAQPIECPANTYRGIVGARNESDCEPCPLNTESTGGAEVCPFKACPAGFYSINGKYSATPGASAAAGARADTCKRCIESPPPPPPSSVPTRSPPPRTPFMRPAPVPRDRFALFAIVKQV